MQTAREIESDPAAYTQRASIYAIAPDGHAPTGSNRKAELMFLGPTMVRTWKSISKNEP